MTAQQEYRARSKVVTERVNKLNELLALHKRKAKEYPELWTYPVELSYVIQALEDINTFLGEVIEGQREASQKPCLVKS